MKIALTVKGAGLGAWLDEDFSHCGHVMIVGEDNRFTSWPNPIHNDPKAQGALLAEKVIAENIDVLITGTISQETQNKLEETGIEIVVRDGGTVFELVERVRNQ